MQETGIQYHHSSDMKLWVTHSQFIVEHINVRRRRWRGNTPCWRLSIWRSAIWNLARLRFSAASSARKVRQAAAPAHVNISGVAGHAVTWLIEHSGTTLQRIGWPSEHHAHHFVDGSGVVRITVSG